MKRVFGYVDPSDDVVSVLDPVPLLELSTAINGCDLTCCMANGVDLATAVVDLTDYTSYLTSMGVSANNQTVVTETLTDPKSGVLGMSIDGELVFGIDGEALSELVGMKAAGDAAEMSTKMFNFVDTVVTNGWYSETLNSFNAGDMDEVYGAFCDAFGCELTNDSHTDHADVCELKFATDYGNSIFDYAHVRGMGWEYKWFYIYSINDGACGAQVKFDLLATNTPTIVNTGGYNFGIGGSAEINGLETHRLNLIGTLQNSDLITALTGANLFNTGNDFSAAAATLALQSACESGLLLEFTDNMKMPVGPLGFEDFLVLSDPTSPVHTVKGTDWSRLDMTPTRAYCSVSTELLAHFVHDDETEDLVALSNDPGLVRAVVYGVPIQIPDSCVLTCNAYLHYKESVDAADDPDEWLDTTLTTDESVTFADVNARLSAIPQITMSVNPSTSVFQSADHTIGTPEDAMNNPANYTAILNYSVVGESDVYEFKLLHTDGTLSVIDQEDFEIVVKSEEVPLTSDTGLSDALNALYGTDDMTSVLNAMNAGSFSAGTARSYDFNWDYIFASRYPDLSELDEDKLKRGIMLTEGVSSDHLKEFIAAMMLLSPRVGLFEAA